MNKSNVPQPLPAHSRALQTRRYHATVHGSRNDRGGWPLVAEGRFMHLEQAQAWADAEYADAPLVSIDLLTAASGWRARHVLQRREGKWISPTIRST